MAMVYASIEHETNINLIVTDYCISRMTGYDLLKRGSSNLNEIPVVIVSSENVLPESRNNYSSNNLIIDSSFVTKPDILCHVLSSCFVYQYRCLEEGAKEFMLEPTKQSDVKKLRCHMTK
ncbi:hypothetical protein H5410_021466, partial [Solanum commersonii]